MKTYGISTYHIDNYLWDTEKSMWKAVGIDGAIRAIDPLRFYIETGRASTTFLRKMILVKPFVLGRYLVKIQDNSVDTIIELIKKKIGYEY